MLKNKVDFFFYKQAYQTILNTALLEHHFSFDKHYVPTKLGRSTLRRADYITLNKAYNYTSKRPFMMIVYIINNPKSSQNIQLSLNNDLYNLAFEELYVFEIPENTKIAFNSHNQVNIILFEYDDILTPDKPSLINMASQNSQTNLEIININNNHLCKSHDKPFFFLYS